MTVRAILTVYTLLAMQGLASKTQLKFSGNIGCNCCNQLAISIFFNDPGLETGEPNLIHVYRDYNSLFSQHHSTTSKSYDSSNTDTRSLL